MNSKHGTRLWRYFSLLALLITLAFSTAAQAGYSVSLVGTDWYGPNNAPYTVFHYRVSWLQDAGSQNSLSHVDLGGCFALADVDFAHSTPGAQWVAAGTDNSFPQCDPAMIVGNVVKFPPPLGGLPSGGSMIVDLALFGLRSPGGTAGWWVKAGTQSCASGSTIGTCGPTRHPGELLSCTLSDQQVCGTGTVALTPAVTDQYPVASYLWSNGATSPSVNVGSGSYSVTITDTHGFSTTCQANVSVNPPPVAEISGDLRFCEGGSTTLTASGGVSYLWSTGEVTPVISVTSGGAYTVTVTSDKGCKDSKTVIVVADKKPNPKITASGDLKFCEGGSVTLTASGADSYLWSNGATTDSITVSASGTFSVTGTNNNSTCGPVTSAAVVVTVDKKPTAEIAASGPLTFCEGGSVTLTASGGLSYHWSNGVDGPSITVSDSGTYTVTASNQNSCSTADASVTVTVDKKPTAKIDASGALTFCEGGSVTLTASGGLSYHWSNGASGASITVSESGTYTVTSSNENTCDSATASVTVQVDKKPTPHITASGPLTFCEGGSVTLTASGGVSYHWSNGVDGPSITVSDSGTYTVTASNQNSCSTATDSVTVQVDKKPVPKITASGPLSFCQGGRVTLTASGGTSYHWSTGDETASITVTEKGTYTVTVSNNNTCDPATASVVVDVFPCPSACTLTQGAWGSAGGAGRIGDVTNAISGFYGGSLVLGLPANNSAFTANTADAPCVVAALPGGGPAAAIGSLGTFSSNCTTNPKALLKNGKFNNVLLGQTFALSLNMTSNAKLLGSGYWYSTFSSMPLDYTITTGTVVNGLPISQTTYTLGKAGAMAKDVGTLLDMANQALGNGLAAKYPGLSISDVNMAVDAVNRAFDGCRSEIAVGPVAPLTPQAMSLAAKGTDICDGSRVIELNGQTSRLDLPASVLDAMARLNLAPTVESLATIDDMVMRGEAVDGVNVDDLTTAVNTINHIAIEGRFIIPCNQ